MEEIYGQTTTDPLSLATLAVLAVLVLVLPRRNVPVLYVLLACVVPFSQRIVVGGLDFNFTRLLVMVGMARIAMRGDARGMRLNPLDYAVVGFTASSAIIPILREASAGEFVYQLGRVFDAIGIYFVLRPMIRRPADIAAISQNLIWLSIPIAGLFALEWITRHNFFSIYAGIPPDAWVFEGRVRCRGAFVHPILAGAFWAALLPLVAVRFFQPGANRALVVAGVLSVFTIALSVGSSTPLLVLIITSGAAFLYPFRFHLRWLRWAIVAVLVGLQLVMNAPVWHLISRIGVLSGSTGYHRYRLIDSFVNNVGEWFLLGMRTTAHWGHGMTDVTNEFIAQGVRGGFSSFALLVLIFVFAFQQTGKLLRGYRRERQRSIYVFALGLCLVAHLAAMFAVSYWAQILVPWNLTLAGVAALTAARDRSSTRKRARNPVRSHKKPATEVTPVTGQSPGPSISRPEHEVAVGSSPGARKPSRPRSVADLWRDQ